MYRIKPKACLVIILPILFIPVNADLTKEVKK